MEKKCVRWTDYVRTPLVAAAAIVTAMVVSPAAQTGEPATQPRLAFADLSYVGGFRLPAEASNGDTFSFGGKLLTFNPASNSLFVGSRAGRVAEVSIPSPVNNSNPAAMPFASYLQPFADPTEGNLSRITGEGVALDGLMVYGNRLYGTASVYYDANNVQQVSHYSRSLQLNEPSFQGWSRVWDAGKSGFVSGSMSVVPPEWRNLLGGPAATGQCCIPIVWRTSWGPSAFAFDPTQIGQQAVAASPLLYYPGEHPTLGLWDSSNPTYGATIQMGGMAIIAGTRTVLYFGRNGTGPNCYGNGTNDRSLDGLVGADGAHWCYDPTSTDKSQHAYPYRYQIWAYDLNDFAAVKAGTKQPWEIVPYGVWPFDFPTAEASVRIGGVGYDAANQLLYVSQILADKDGYSYRPIVHVIRVNATPGSNDPSATELSFAQQSTATTSAQSSTALATANTATTTASTSNVVSAISLSVNRVAPQLAGAAITFSAFATSGTQQQEYKWLVDDGSGLKAVTPWSVADTFVWTPQTGNAAYRVGVWARRSGNASDAPEASASTPFAITAPTTLPLRSVRIGSDKPSPQPLGASVTWTATTDGGSALQYKWLVHDGGSWAAVSAWSTVRTFTWTPAAANSNYRVGVWVRSGGSTRDEAEVTASADFPMTSTSSSASPSSTQVAANPVVTLASTAVQPGALIQFTVSGGPGSRTDWVTLSLESAADRGYLDWNYLNGQKTAPATARSGATLQFTAPATPGTYNIRFFADNRLTRLTTSATIVVGTPPSTSGPAVTLTSSTVQRGAPIQLTVSGGPASRLDWVALSPASAPDNGYLDWRYLNGQKTAPAIGQGSATLQFTAPSTPGTYNLRFFADNRLNLLATSAIVVVQ